MQNDQWQSEGQESVDEQQREGEEEDDLSLSTLRSLQLINLINMSSRGG
jgi:hypothetical protein